MDLVILVQYIVCSQSYFFQLATISNLKEPYMALHYCKFRCQVWNVPLMTLILEPHVIFPVS